MECFSCLSGEIAMMSADPVTALHGAQGIRHNLASGQAGGQEYTLLVIDDALQGGAQNLSSILRRTFPQSTVITCASVDDVIRELTRSNPQAPCVVTRAKDDLGRLSAREEQVLALVAKGLQIAEVARALEISANTVCSHLKNIYRKRKVCSRAEAALEAQRLGLV
jgi:DNA-binding NarL/FixJ family response regulator